MTAGSDKAPPPGMVRPLRVLFACTYNATRSPMAQALARAMGGRGGVAPIEAASAGVFAGAPLDPMAIEVMAELGADIADHHPHSFADLEADGGDLEAFDVVVALSPAAERRAIEYLRDTETPVEFWRVADATAEDGSETTRAAAYRAARDAIQARIRNRFAA